MSVATPAQRMLFDRLRLGDNELMARLLVGRRTAPERFYAAEGGPSLLLSPGSQELETGKAWLANPFPERLRNLKIWVSEEAGPEATTDALMSTLPYSR